MILDRVAKGESTILTRWLRISTPSLTNIIKATNMEDPLCIEIMEEVGYKLVIYCRPYQYFQSRLGGHWRSGSRCRRIYHVAYSKCYPEIFTEFGQQRYPRSGIKIEK